MNHPSNRPTIDTVEDLVSHHPPSALQVQQHARIRAATRTLIETILEVCPDCADRAAAIRKAREAMMTANAAIALEPAIAKDPT